MRKFISVVTGALLLTMSFFPAGAFAAEKPTAQYANIFKSEFSNHAISKPINSSLKEKLDGLLTPNTGSAFKSNALNSKDLGDTITETEPNNNPLNGQFDGLPLGDFLVGNMSNTDIDFHKIDVQNDGESILLIGASDDFSHTLGFVLTDSNLNSVTTDSDIYYDPDSGLVYEVMEKLPHGTYYAAAFDETDPADNLSYGYALFATTLATTPIVDPVHMGDRVLTGVADPGETVYVQELGNTPVSQTVDNNGNFSMAITPQKTGATLSVYAYDPISDSFSDTVTVSVLDPVDTTAPSAPKVNPIDDNDLSITGTAEYGSTITIKNGSKVIGTSTANDKTGAFQFKLTHSLAAGTALSITATDKAGNVSKPANVKVLDKTAPAKPSVNSVSDASTSVTGKTEANATVTVKAGSKVLGSKKADSKGAFSVGIAKQKAGTTLNVYAADAAGNKSPNTVVKVLDKTAPAKPSVNSVSDASTSVTGKTEAYATVTVKAGSKVLGSKKADSKGAFSVGIAKQRAGTTLNVYAADAAGNKSPNTVVKVLDKTAPAKPKVYTFGDNSTVVSGKVEPGAKVTIAYGKTVLGVSTASSNGDFHVSVKKKQKAGEVLTAYATDKAGNRSAGQTFKVADKTPPGTPTVNKVTTRSTSVSGKAEKGATVYLYSGHHYYGKATASSKGYYKIGMHKQKKGTKLSVYAKDKAGNKSKTRTIKVV